MKPMHSRGLSCFALFCPNGMFFVPFHDMLSFCASQVPRKLIGTDGFQETPIVEVTRAITKHNYLVMDIADLPRIVKEAFYLARCGGEGNAGVCSLGVCQADLLHNSRLSSCCMLVQLAVCVSS